MSRSYVWDKVVVRALPTRQTRGILARRRVTAARIVQAAILSVIVGCDSGKTEPAAITAESDADRDRVPTELTTPKYVGSAVCAECHEEEAERYLLTPHGNSFASVRPENEPPDGQVVHAPSRLTYSIYRDGDSLRHRESLLVDGEPEQILADHPVVYVVGTGNSAQTYLIEDDGFLAESPVTWYASQGAWGMSPGYEENNTGFGRAVYRDCLYCHCGRVETTERSDRSVRIRELAIGCERCHGPGEDHVRSHRGLDSQAEEADSIVNPGSLSRDQVESICGQCHLHSVAQVARRNRDPHDFVPGSALSDFRVDFRHLRSHEGMTVTGHAEQLYLSACYQKTTTLSCITCHDPHGDISASERAGLMKHKCLDCHDSESCTEEPRVRMLTQLPDNCVECHMPESTTEVPHVAATHHRIGIHPTQARTIEDTADSRELSELFDVDWESESDRQRGFGLAYLAASKEQSERRSSEEYRRIATLQLQSAYDAGIHDSDVACGLATALLPTAPDRALRLAEVVLQETEYTTETRIDALWIAATVRMQRRQLNEAIPVLRELTLLRRQGADWFQLAACLHALGRNEDAIEIAERAVAIRPAVAVYRELLASIYASVDRQEDAEEQYALARELVQ